MLYPSRIYRGWTGRYFGLGVILDWALFWTGRYFGRALLAAFTVLFPALRLSCYHHLLLEILHDRLVKLITQVLNGLLAAVQDNRSLIVRQLSFGLSVAVQVKQKTK